MELIERLPTGPKLTADRRSPKGMALGAAFYVAEALCRNGSVPNQAAVG